MATPAAEAGNKRKRKATITEDHVWTLLHRYNPSTIFLVLQEVAQLGGAKIDWHHIVKQSSTGITSAREYQMLWRHLAYQHEMLDKIDSGAELLDDESDLEFELEAIPSTNEAALEDAKDCVKALMTPGNPHDVSNRTFLDGQPNSHKVQMPRVPSDKQLVPSLPNLHDKKLLQSQVLSCAEALDAKKKKKAKTWTKEEEEALMSAVEKHGDNWAEIQAKLGNGRTAAQYSQRYATIRKRQTLANQHSWKPSANADELKATQRAINNAIQMPMFSSALHSASQSNAAAPSRFLEARPSVVAALPAPPPPPSTSHNALKAPVQKPKKTTPKKKAAPAVNSVSTIQEVAIAAGARVVRPSAVSFPRETAQPKNAMQSRIGIFSKSIASCKPTGLSVGTQAAFNQFVESSTMAPDSSSAAKQKGQQLDGRSKFAGVDCATNPSATGDLKARQNTSAAAASNACDDGQESDVGDLVLDELMKED